MDDPVELDDLLKEFVEKASSDLEAMESLRRDLRRDPSNPESLGKLLDLVRTTKGACAFLSLPRIASVVTSLATLLESIQEGRVAPNPGTTTLVLGTLSRLRQLVNGVAQNGVEPEGEDSVLLDAVDRLLNAQGDGEAEPPGEPVSAGMGTEGWASVRDVPPPDAGETAPDATTVASPSASSAAPIENPEHRLSTEPQTKVPESASRSSRYLLFRVAPEGLKAVPVGSVAWLDLVDMAAVDRSGNRPIAKVRGWRLPLVPFDAARVLPRTGRRSVVILEDKGRRVGLAVDEIVGVIDRLIPTGVDDGGGPPKDEGPIEPIEAGRMVDRVFRLRARS